MELDEKLDQLPLTKSNPKTLRSLFGQAEVTPMWVADMEFQIAQPIQDALIKRVTGSGFGYEYKPDSFFLAQKRWYQNEYNIDLNREDILFSPTISTTIAILIELFTQEGDGIIIQPPVFMEFRDTIRKTKRKIIKNPLQLRDNHYEIGFDDLKKKAQSTQAKILIICNPHNPVGRVWTPEELEEVVNICKANDLLLIADEIHKDIILFGHQFTSLLSFQHVYDKIVVCTSEAKSFNLCGIADAMAIIPSEDIRHLVAKVLKKYNLGRTNALTRIALETAYSEGRDWLDKVLKTIETNVEGIEAALQNSNIGFVKPEGTYQVWLDFREVYRNTKDMFVHLTQESGVAMNAGHWFGREGALFMRMNVATTHEKVIHSIGRIKDAVAKG